MLIENAILVTQNTTLVETLSPMLKQLGFEAVEVTNQITELEVLCCSDGTDTVLICEVDLLLITNNRIYFKELLNQRNAQIIVVLKKDQVDVLRHPAVSELIDGFIFHPVDPASLQATIQMAKILHNRNLDLTISEDKFQRLFHNSPEPSLLIINGVFVDCNQAALQILNAERSQVIGLQPAKLSPPTQPDGRDSQEKADEMIQHALVSGYHIFEWAHIRLDGSEFIAEVVLIAIPLNDKPAIFVKWRDVSDIEEYRRSLIISKEQYQQLFETMLNGFSLHEMLYDDSGMPFNYRFLAVNPAFERLTGLRADQIIGKTVLDVLPKIEPVWLETYGRVAQSGMPELIENYSSDLDRYFRVYAFSPQCGQFATLLEDITSQKQNEKFQSALIKMSEELRQVYSSIELANVVVGTVSRLLQIDNVTIAIRSPQYSDRFQFIAGGGLGAGWIEKEITLNQGVSGFALRNRRPYFHNNILEEPHHLLDLQQYYTRCIAALPLITDKENLGVLVLGKDTAFRENDQRILTAMGDLISNALHRIQLQEKTQQTVEYLSALRKIDLTITSGENLEKRLDVILAAVIEHQNVDAASIWLKQSDKGNLELSGFQGFISQLPIGFQSNLPGLFVEIDRPAHLRGDQLHDNLCEPFQSLISSDGFNHYLSVPLVTKKSYWGILQLWKRSEITLTDEWTTLLEMLAGQAAIAIEDLRLLMDLQHHLQELQIAYDSTLEGWAKALEIRDAETQDHSRRVTEIIIHLARLMDIPEDDIPHIRRGTMLHDIGKMGIPDAILNKQGPLTPQEWEIMHRHPQMAYDVLSGISFLEPALDIPYCHHEKWDGSGYPRGLRGEEIPLAARIFAVVDVWDALLSDRPYRRAWSVSDTITYISEQSGKHFDPRVVEVFLSFIQNKR